MTDRVETQARVVMNTDRIRAIQDNTAYPNSRTVQAALLQVWNECGHEAQQLRAERDAMREDTMEKCCAIQKTALIKDNNELSQQVAVQDGKIDELQAELANREAKIKELEAERDALRELVSEHVPQPCRMRPDGTCELGECEHCVPRLQFKIKALEAELLTTKKLRIADVVDSVEFRTMADENKRLCDWARVLEGELAEYKRTEPMKVAELNQLRAELAKMKAESVTVEDIGKYAE